MSVNTEGLQGNIKIANVFHHLVQALNMNFDPYIYILYYQSNLLNYLPPNPASYSYKIEYCICNGGVGTARSETCVHNDVTIRELRHANVDRQSKLLADVDVTLPRGTV